MFCPNCGYSNAEGDNFCRQCGKRLADAVDTADTADTPDVTTEIPDADFSAEGDPSRGFRVHLPPPGDFGEPEERPRDEEAVFRFRQHLDVRNAFRAPAILLALLCYSVTMGVYLFNLFDVPYAVSRLMNEVDGAAAISAISTLSSLLFLVPQALILAGSWMTYAYAGVGHAATTGLTMVKVALIIQLVLLCISLGLIDLVFIVALGLVLYEPGGFYEYDQVDLGADFWVGLLIFLALFIIAVTVLAIIYYVKTIRMVGVMRESFATGVPSDKIPTFVAVFLFIGGGCTVLSAFNALLYGELFSVLGNACSATASIAFGVFLLQYRAKMRELLFPMGNR